MPLFDFATTTLKSAAEQVPAVKYAVGLTGVAAALAIIIFLTGSVTNPIPLIGLVFIGGVILFIFSVAVASGIAGGKVVASILVWCIIIFFLIFLGFTVSAFASGLPCNWAKFIAVDPHRTCGNLPLRVGEEQPDEKSVYAETPQTRVDSFTYTASDPDDPGIRYWRRVAPDRWEEKFPSGEVSFFGIKKRINFDGCDGSVVAKVGDPNLELLIPDVGCANMDLKFRRSPSRDWSSLNRMRKVNQVE